VRRQGGWIPAFAGKTQGVLHFKFETANQEKMQKSANQLYGVHKTNSRSPVPILNSLLPFFLHLSLSASFMP